MGGVNDYLLEVLVADHLRDSRAAAARRAVAAEHETPLRLTVGRALIRIGCRLVSAQRGGGDAAALARRPAPYPRVS
jgi:hypothetical protein